MKTSSCCAFEPLPRPDLEGLPAERGLLSCLTASLTYPHRLVERFTLGGRFVGVLAGDQVGLASTLGARPGPRDQAVLAELTGDRLVKAAQLLFSPSPILASLGLAALNAGFSAPEREELCHRKDWLGGLCQGRRVAVAGDFPFIASLRSVASELQLLELRPSPDAAPPSKWSQIIASCQVAVITGTAILTHSLAWLLGEARQAVKIVIGPSTPLAPVLFSQGADILAGCLVKNPPAVLEAVGADQPFWEIKKKGVELICWPRPDFCMDDYICMTSACGAEVQA
jgi:uncharacterized protein (DUF4213/DUF364 family)